jgi:transcriptional regulator with XRE-family HTH domain
MARIKKDTRPARKLTFLRQWREHRDLTLEEAAEKMEMHHTSLMRVEKGVVPYNQDFLERAALVYGCDATDFLDNDPRAWNLPRLVFDRLRQAPPEKQREAMAIIDALLKAG